MPVYVCVSEKPRVEWYAQSAPSCRSSVVSIMKIKNRETHHNTNNGGGGGKEQVESVRLPQPIPPPHPVHFARHCPMPSRSSPVVSWGLTTAPTPTRAAHTTGSRARASAAAPRPGGTKSRRTRDSSRSSGAGSRRTTSWSAVPGPAAARTSWGSTRTGTASLRATPPRRRPRVDGCSSVEASHRSQMQMQTWMRRRKRERARLARVLVLALLVRVLMWEWTRTRTRKSRWVRREGEQARWRETCSSRIRRRALLSRYEGGTRSKGQE